MIKQMLKTLETVERTAMKLLRSPWGRIDTMHAMWEFQRQHRLLGLIMPERTLMKIIDVAVKQKDQEWKDHIESAAWLREHQHLFTRNEYKNGYGP